MYYKSSQAELSDQARTITSLQHQLTEARKELAETALKELVNALKIYARRYKDGKCWNWNNIVCDSYSGEVPHFDYHGDEQDEPWEIAESALARFQAAGVTPSDL